MPDVTIRIAKSVCLFVCAGGAATTTRLMMTDKKGTRSRHTEQHPLLLMAVLALTARLHAQM